MLRRVTGAKIDTGADSWRRRTPRASARKCVAPRLGSASTSRGASRSHAESSTMKERAPKRISWPMLKSPPDDMMKRYSRKLAGSRLDACPTVGANCRGYKSDSRCVGYERMGRALATARMYEFRPLYGGGKSPTSQCSWELDVEWNIRLQ